MARLKRMSATAAEDVGAWEGSDGGGRKPPPVLEPTFAPRLPARKAPFPVTASTQRPPTPSAPAEEGSARAPPPMSGRAVLEPPPARAERDPCVGSPALSRFSFQGRLPG